LFIAIIILRISSNAGRVFSDFADNDGIPGKCVITLVATLAESGNLNSYDSSSPSHNSPTSVATNVMTHLPGMPSLSAKSEKTRPALFEMRKMMMAMNNNNRSNGNKSNLPCAAGKDYLYLDTLRNLQKSMDRTKKSRKSLSIQTTGTEQYGRSLCVHQIVKSVQISSAQVDTCLQSVVGC
jgi:hypothetical protein